MSLKQRLRRLQRKAQEGGVLVYQRDGSVKVFDTMHVHAEMFMAQMDLFRDTARDSDVLEAVRNATPESRVAFEERFGPIRIVARIIGSGRGGWVEQKILTEDGEVLRVMYEADSEEAALVRSGIRAGTDSETSSELPLPPVAGR